MKKKKTDRRSRKNVTEEEYQEWERLRESGISYDNIGNQYGFSGDTIRVSLYERKGVPSPKRADTNQEELSDWVAQYTDNEELTATDIARDSKRSVTTVNRHLRKMGLPVRSKGGRRKKNEEGGTRTP